MSDFRVTPDGYLLDGAPFRILAGAMHYFRTLPQQWPDRLELLRAMGLNTVETYVPWNLHEPAPGDYRDVGQISRFLEAAAAAELKAIVRPGPYICAEWENGGLPHWLRTDRDTPLRCADPDYLAAVDRWFDTLVPELRDHQATRGGPLLMVQVENEYGSYGDDAGYLEHLRAGLVDRGIDVPLFTSDGATDTMLTGGTLPGVHATVNFGSEADEEFAVLAEHRPHDPPTCMEFWNGWFDHWGSPHTTRDPEDAAAELEKILAAGASVNLYMAHGGTSFGLMAGANTAGAETADGYRPTVTSYDYDAPIDEAGRPTAKFWAYRKVFARHGAVPAEPPARLVAPPLLPPARLRPSRALHLFDVLEEIGGPEVEAAHLPSFEELGLGQGLVLHRSRLVGPRRDGGEVNVRDLRDRAWLFTRPAPAEETAAAPGEAAPARRFTARFERAGSDRAPVAVAPGGLGVELLVESMGRVNYGVLTGERKGVLGGFRHGYQFVSGWHSRPVDLAAAAGRLPWRRATPAARPGTSADLGPVFWAVALRVDTARDGFLAVEGGSKGVVWVNGFCLGRYWEIGPQRTLYLPAPLLHPGDNEITLLELEPAQGRQPTVALREGPELG